jgi:hypothetical protein
LSQAVSVASATLSPILGNLSSNFAIILQIGLYNIKTTKLTKIDETFKEY